MKKIFTLLCAALLTLSAGAEIIIVGNYKYEVTTPYSSSNAILAGFKDNALSRSSVYIHPTIEYNSYTMKVVGIKENAFEDETSIKWLTIDDANMTSIGKYAFWGCTALESIDFKNTSANLVIGEQAFWGCNALTGVSLPNMKQLCNAAFGSCANLNVAVFYNIDILSQNAFYQCPKFDRIGWYNTKTLKITKSGNDNTTYAVSSSANTSPFYEVRSQLVKISIGGTVQDYLFQSLTALEEVAVGGDLLKIGNYAFDNCTSLKKLDYLTSADDLTYIGDYAFRNCPIANDLYFRNDKLAYIGTQAFLNNHARTIWLSSDNSDQQVGVEIGTDAFSNAYTKHICILCKVKSLGHKSFRCSVADTIQYRPLNGYTTSGANTTPFDGCNKVSYILVRSSGDLGSYIFAFCTNLRKVDLMCGNVAGTAFLNCSNIEEVIWNANTDYDYTGLEHPFRAGHNISKVEFHGTRIPAFLFCNQTNLKNFTVGSAVTEIGKSAFYGAGLQFLTIKAGESTLNIRNNAFKDNSTLRQITCEYTTPPTLGDEVFLGCNEDLKNIDLIIPDGSESLYRAAKGWKEFFEPVEGIEDVQSDDAPCTKVLRDGKIYIKHGGRLFDLTGAEVR